MSSFPIVIGIDEAGLGPILGPLTIGYTAFRVPAPLSGDGVLKLNLWKALNLGKSPGARKHRRVVCDSKVIYSSGNLKPLEEEVLCWAALTGAEISDYAPFRGALCPLAQGRCEDYDWYLEPPRPFPMEADVARTRLRGEPIRRALDQSGVAIETLGVMPVLEGELNRLLGRGHSKGRAEFECIGRILGHFWQRHARLAVLVDRQGGRTQYAHSLSREFPEARVQTLHESPKISSYELTIPEVDGCPRMFIAFIEKGETDHMPIALASMFAKYVRELHMQQFNQWWAQHDAALRPTAGYYGDGRRWLADTISLRAAIGIDEDRLIRRK